MDEQLDRRTPWVPWAIASVVLLTVAAVSYFIGLQATPAIADGETARHAWRSAHFGPFWIPMLVVLWIACSRLFWWGPRWPYYPWHYRGYYRPWPPAARDEWEEWHREAHRRSDGGTGPDRGREPRQP